MLMISTFSKAWKYSVEHKPPSQEEISSGMESNSIINIKVNSSKENLTDLHTEDTLLGPISTIHLTSKLIGQENLKTQAQQVHQLK